MLSVNTPSALSSFAFSYPSFACLNSSLVLRLQSRFLESHSFSSSSSNPSSVPSLSTDVISISPAPSISHFFAHDVKGLSLIFLKDFCNIGINLDRKIKNQAIKKI